MKCTDGEVKYTRVDLDHGDEKRDNEAWFKIYDSYIDEFGLSKQYNKMLNTLKKKATLELDYTIKRDKFLLTLLEIEQQNLKLLLDNNGVGVTINESLVHLSKFVGYWLRPKDITTREYFTLLKEVERINKIENGKKN